MPDVNDKAPDFSLHDTSREQVSLKDYEGKKLVIAFFPAAFTGVCEKELCTFRDSLADLNGLGAEVVAISADAPFSNGAFAAKTGANFPVLSDYTRSTIKAYGVELPDFAGLPGYLAAQRSVFVVNGQGGIIYKWIAENPGIEPNYDEVKAALA
jgi:peroxiredoxin